MAQRLRIALVACAGLTALAFAGQALGAYNPQVQVTSTPESVTVGYQQGNDDDATARITFFVPLGVQANLSQAAGTQIGAAGARVFVGALGAEATLQGPVVVGDPTNATVRAQGTACTGVAAHAAVWILRVALSDQPPLDIPAFVDPATGAAAQFASQTIAICFRSPYIPPAQGGQPSGVRPLEAALTLTNVFSFPATSGEFRWTGLFIPYAVGSGMPNVGSAAESQAIAGYPIRFGITGKLVVKTKTVRRRGKARRVKSYWARVGGQLRAGGDGVAGATVNILAGARRAGTARTNSNGSFSRLFRITRTTTFRATAAAGGSTSSATCQPVIPIALPPPLTTIVTPRCTGVTTGVVAAASNAVRVRKRG